MEDYNDGEFHLWHGGECPVHPKSVVDVRFRAPEKTGAVLSAKNWKWGHLGCNLDIVMFRVVTPHRAPVHLPETIGPDHPAVTAFSNAYISAIAPSAKAGAPMATAAELIADGLTAALKCLREGGE